MSIHLTIGADDDGRRIDRILRKYLGSGVPLSTIYRLIRTGKIRVDGSKVDISDRVHEGSQLVLPELKRPSQEERRSKLVVEPERNMKLDVLWEGKGLLVAVKPAGMIVHGKESLEERVRAYLTGKLPASLSFRPGPLHRLDRGTSGIIVFSTSLEGAQGFSAALRGRMIRKRYLAVLDGELAKPEIWRDTMSRDRDVGISRVYHESEEDDVGGQIALTKAFPLARVGGVTLALMEIETGRTHQIRVQAANRGTPLLGDGKYGKTKGKERFYLHAYELASKSENYPALPSILVAPPPERFLKIVNSLLGAEIAQRIAEGIPTDTLLSAII